jgi:hypothetical protein
MMPSRMLMKFALRAPAGANCPVMIGVSVASR